MTFTPGDQLRNRFTGDHAAVTETGETPEEGVDVTLEYVTGPQRGALFTLTQAYAARLFDPAGLPS